MSDSTVPEPVLHGADYSVYTRIARLALAEKGVACRMETVDVFAPGGPPPAHLLRHPFGRIPAFSHGAVALYEAAAIARYVDEAFDGPPLQPADAAARARMTQIVSIMDSYAFRPLVLTIYVERMASHGRPPDEPAIAASLPQAARCLAALTALLGNSPYLAGPTPSLADFHAAPMIAYFRLAPEGAAFLSRHETLLAWWQRISVRPAMLATRFPAEIAREAMP